MYLIYDGWAVNLDYVRDFRVLEDAVRFFFDEEAKHFIEWKFKDEVSALRAYRQIFQSNKVDYLSLDKFD